MKSLLKYLEFYQIEIERVDRELQNSPPGYLVRKKKQYYHSSDGKEIGITKQPALVKRLCRKRYLIAYREQLNHNLLVSVKNLGDYDQRTTLDLIESLPNSYQEVPLNYFYHPEIAQWATAEYEQNTHPTPGGSYFSKHGTPIRSKSEALIASLLEDYNLPYRYDAILQLGGQKKSPDFTIRHPFNGKTFIWEHFGALHRPDYEQKMNDKMALYLRQGYVPFETLIYTFEFDLKEPKRLKNLIEDIIL